MTWSQILFSFNGRLNRARYWLAALVYVASIVIALLLASSLVGVSALSNPGAIEMTGTVIALIAVFGILYLVILYSAVAVAVKRLHDRDKSGWWVILFYIVPGILQGGGRSMGESSGMGGSTILGLVGGVISIWALIELGFLKGTNGDNQYGRDPLTM